MYVYADHEESQHSKSFSIGVGWRGRLLGNEMTIPRSDFFSSLSFFHYIFCSSPGFMKHGLTSHIELWSEPVDELPSREPPPHSPLCVPRCILPRCKSSSLEASTLAPRGTSCKMNQQPSQAGWLKWKWQGTCLGGTGAQLCCLSDKQAQYSSC